jgi:hypothetical protein
MSAGSGRTASICMFCGPPPAAHHLPSDPFPSAILTRIRMDTGETSILTPITSNLITGDGAALYLYDFQSIQRFDLASAALTRIVSLSDVSVGSIWANQGLLYVVVSGPEGAIAKVDPTSSQVSLIAGDLHRDLDGVGANVDFSVYLLPVFMGIYGDSRSIYILEHFSLRSYDRSTGVVSTLATLNSTEGGIWSDGLYTARRRSLPRPLGHGTKLVLLRYPDGSTPMSHRRA